MHKSGYKQSVKRLNHESIKRLGAYEEVPRKNATSTPLLARLILVTKPNVHGGPATEEGSNCHLW